MKQRITITQLNELRDEQKQKLREWWQPQPYDVYVAHESTVHIAIGSLYSGTMEQVIDFGDQFGRNHYKSRCLPLLSIGQMVELIQQECHLFKGIERSVYNTWYVSIGIVAYGYKEEICDALWEAVVKIL